jgi:hypothetical protein
MECVPKAKDVGNYTATVKLTDNNKNPLTTIYKIKIEILPGAFVE